MRLALGISYNGQAYQGWQSQSSGLTVQDQLEKALGRLACEKISTLSAGRTDSGVHGLMQVIHFDTQAVRTTQAWVRGTNSMLPKDIAVQWARQVPDSFHCRASAISRRYRYLLLDSPVRPSFDFGRVGWSFMPLRIEPMQKAANHLLGEHDFSSFRASACQALSPVKTMLNIDIAKRGTYWSFDFEANAFLHHMIRNIMGCLVAVGQGKMPPGWMVDVLAAKSRRAAAPTFSAHGLYFLGPRYAPHWELPDITDAYDSLP